MLFITVAVRIFLCGLAVALEGLDSEQTGKNQNNSNGKRHPGILYESGNNVCNERNNRCQYRVRKLCGNMVYMVALRTGACHNGGV